MKSVQKNRSQLMLVVIMIVAAVLRLYDLNWDEGQHAHPDERWIAMVAPSITWPDRLADLLNPRRSTLNPLWNPDGQGGGEQRNFAYGHLPLYLHSLLGHAVAAVGKEMLTWGEGYHDTAYELLAMGEYANMTLIGRLLSVLFDLGTVYLVYLMGRSIYGQRVGLLGAALVALAVSHIQQAHFATFDAITTFFVVLAVYGAIRVIQARERYWWATIWSAAAVGMAVASKFSALPLVAVLAVAQVIRLMRGEGELDIRSFLSFRLWQRSLVPILLSLAVVAVVFFLVSPFAVLDLKLYLRQIGEQGAMVRGEADWPFTRQYRNTTPFLYQIEQQVYWGLGWPLGVFAFAGFGWVLLRQFRQPRVEEWVILGWTVPYFALTGTFLVKFMRYMLPLLPFFVLMGAEMMWRMSLWARGRLAAASPSPASSRVQVVDVLRRGLQYLALAAPYAVLTLTMLWAVAFAWVYAQEHPWIQASRWMYDHLPDGSVLAVEHWDDHLPLALPEDFANPGAHQYTHLELPMYEPDGYAKYDLVRNRLRQADYIVLATNRLYRTIPRLPGRYPVSGEFYRLLFAEELGFVREAEFTAYPGLFGLTIVDDAADESFTVYDHPKPIVFRKVRDLENLEWDRLFAQALAKQPVWEYDQLQEGDWLSFLSSEPPQEGEEAKTLLLDRPVGELPVVDDFGWNRWASDSTVGAVLVWWLAVALLGWLVWPIVFAVFGGLRDRGYLLSRSVALLLVGYLVWLPSSLHWLQNGLPLTFGAIGVLALVSGALLWRNRAEMRVFLRDRWRVILIGEAVFGLAFLFFVGIRLLNPDLWQPWNGGEKSMDIAYLNACMRSAYFPPYDPYYSGGYLNYYYYGQFLLSIITRLTGLTTSVAFNLSVPLLFALTVANVFCIGYTLAGKVLGRSNAGRDGDAFGITHGLLAVLFVAVLGNLASATQLIDRLGRLSQSTFASRIPGLEAIVHAADGVVRILFHGAHLSGFNYWDVSRVVEFTINEFPYWSFLFADLHPHMTNIPFTVLVLALALNWLLRKRAPIPSGLAVDGDLPLPHGELSLFRSSFRYVWQRLDWGEVLNWVLWPLALGALAAINTWDFPAYAGLCGLVLLFVWIRDRGRQGVGPALLAGVSLAAASLVLYWPFFKYYTTIHVGVGWSLGRRATDLGEFLVMWGLLLFLALSLLAVAWRVGRMQWGVLRLGKLAFRYLSYLQRLEHACRLFVRRLTVRLRLSLWALLLVVLLLVGLCWRGYWVLALNVALLLFSFALMVQPSMPARRRFVLALAFTAFLLLTGIELFYLEDFLAGDENWWRMNTLFKFYVQVWVMLGVAVGASLPEIWDAVGRWRRGWRWLWTVVFALLLVAAALFPAIGTPARVVDRFPNAQPPLGTLDGMDFMTVGVYTWPNEGNPISLHGDYEAIRWLRDHVKGTPVIAEAPLPYYREFGVRVSSYTGLPTLLGMHESEQRYGWQVGERSAKARELFMTNDVVLTMDLIEQLDVAYVYVGPLERSEYAHSIAKFDQLALAGHLSVVYQNNLVTIYRVQGREIGE